MTALPAMTPVLETVDDRASAYARIAAALRYPEDQPELQDTYHRLFGHAVRGACPPYEMEYGQGEIVQQAPLLADITGFYAAFGLELPPAVHERADHVSVECEFMSVLATKEAWARDSGISEAVEVIHDAQARFLEDHLGRWLPALSRRMEEADPDGFYGELARYAASFIEEECTRFGIDVGPPLLDLRPADPAADATISCGAEESCPGGREEPLVQLGIDRGSLGGGRADRV